MSKVIFIGSDRTIFEEGSLARARMIEYGGLFEELHIIVFTQKSDFGTKVQIAKNTWAYSTNSISRWLYPFGALSKGGEIIRRVSGGDGRQWIVSAQDPFEAGLGALWLSRKIGAKLHIQIHTDFLSPFFVNGNSLNKVRVFLSHFVLPKANGIRVVSERIKNSLLKNSNFRLKSVPVVLPIYSELKMSEEFMDIKSKHPLWKCVILMVGRLEKEKNYLLAFRVLKRINDKGLGAGIVILGNGSEREKLIRLSVKLGIKDNVVFVGKVSNVSSYYQSADMFLHTGDYEGYGLSLVESARFGLPIVTTDVGVVGWLLKNNENCLVSAPRDEDGLVKAISRLIEDMSLRAKFRTHLKADFGKQLLQTKEQYLRAYKESIEQT